MTSTIQQRREAILAHAYQDGHVSVRRLAEELNVSEATVRRDLQGLAAEGALHLNHGGASVARVSEASFLARSTQNIEAKKLIAERAAQLIEDGEQIFIDSGTTCYCMAPYLRAKKGVSVILNSVRTALELYNPSLNVVLLGGQYRPDRMDVIGPMTIDAIDRLRGYRAFIGTDGLGMDFGLTATDMESAHLFGMAARNAREVVLVVDSSKFDAPSLHKSIDFDAVSTIVTNQIPSPTWCDFLSGKNIKIISTDPEKQS
ncbi:MAG: DeoR/GlpR family DNA-binding transcription regulator [Planctomycetota bacterium]